MIKINHFWIPQQPQQQPARSNHNSSLQQPQQPKICMYSMHMGAALHCIETNLLLKYTEPRDDPGSLVKRTFLLPKGKGELVKDPEQADIKKGKYVMRPASVLKAEQGTPAARRQFMRYFIWHTRQYPVRERQRYLNDLQLFDILRRRCCWCEKIKPAADFTQTRVKASRGKKSTRPPNQDPGALPHAIPEPRPTTTILATHPSLRQRISRIAIFYLHDPTTLQLATGFIKRNQDCEDHEDDSRSKFDDFFSKI